MASWRNSSLPAQKNRPTLSDYESPLVLSTSIICSSEGSFSLAANWFVSMADHIRPHKHAAGGDGDTELQPDTFSLGDDGPATSFKDIVDAAREGE